ncbi:MAG: YfcE family phosphodiesterase [Candidatus Aenigmatarchaeota archaeon]
MDVLIIGDMHIPGKAGKIPERFLDEIDKADLVLCTGDFTNEETFQKIAGKAEKLHTVRGNRDFMELPSQDIVNAGGLKIGLIHGHQVERGNLEGLVEVANNMNVKILVSGHTHKPFKTEKDNVLLLNPGTATGADSGESKVKTKTCMKIKIEDGLLERIEIIRD